MNDSPPQATAGMCVNCTMAREERRQANIARVKAQRKAQEALDDPNAVWANQRKQMRKELKGLRRVAGESYLKAHLAEECLSLIANGIEPTNWQMRMLPPWVVRDIRQRFNQPRPADATERKED